MKKTLIGLFMAMFWFGSASAEVGISIGVSGNAALYAANATEFDEGTHGTTSDDDEEQKQSEYMGAMYGSIFAEIGMGIFFVGVDMVPGSIDTETASTTVGDKTTSATSTQVTNTVQVEFDGLTTAYVRIRVLDSLYIKAGSVSVDVTTNETLGTGSTYGDTSLDGSMIGIGVDRTLDNGMFVRAEAMHTDFDGVSLTSSSGSQKITLNSLDGLVGKVSIGKSF